MSSQFLIISPPALVAECSRYGQTSDLQVQACHHLCQYGKAMQLGTMFLHPCRQSAQQMAASAGALVRHSAESHSVLIAAGVHSPALDLSGTGRAHLDIQWGTTLPSLSRKGTRRIRAFCVPLICSMRWLQVVPCASGISRVDHQNLRLQV